MLLIVLQVRDYLSKNFSSSLQCRCSRKMRPFRIFHILKSWLNLILPYLCKGAPKIQVAFGNKLQTLTLLLFVDSRMDVKTLITVLLTFPMMIKEQLALNLQGNDLHFFKYSDYQLVCIFYIPLVKIFVLPVWIHFLKEKCSLLPSKSPPFESPVTAVVAQAQLISLQKKWCFHVFSKASWV